MYLLKVLREGEQLAQLEISSDEKQSFSIGRDPSSDIKLDGRAVGRNHALLLVDSGNLRVQKKSKFGKVTLNGVDVEESSFKAGDELKIADCLVLIENQGVKENVTSEVRSQAALETTSSSQVIDSPELNTAEIKASEESASPAFENEIKNEQAGDAFNASPFGELIQTDLPQEVKVESGLEGLEKTTILSQNQLISTLVLRSGSANKDRLTIDKDEISIGRGSECDLVLDDKKASRKHLVIRKTGAHFVLVDLGSANGTFINGEKTTEKELSGNDLIKVGDSEFEFKAESAEYFEKQQEFISVPQTEQVTDPNQDFNVSVDVASSSSSVGLQNSQGQANLINDFGAAPSGFQTTNLGSKTSNKKETLLEKFKKQPPVRRLLIGLVVMGVMYFAVFEEQKPAKPTNPKKEEMKGEPAFEKLPKEKKQFVINTYDLAYNYYKNEQYDKALYEVEKILQILPTGFKESRDIKVYAQKAIEILKAREEEQKRKENEERLKKELVELVAEAEKLVDEGKDEDAKDVFAKVLEKDPENPTILRLTQLIEEKQAKIRAEKDAEREKEFKIKQLKSLIEEGRSLIVSGQYYEAMAKMEDAPVIYSSDKSLLEEAKQVIEEAKNKLHSIAEPHLAAARSAMSSGNLPEARDSFYKALQGDSRNIEAKEGLDKIRDILRERARKLFSEGVILEGVSDFNGALEKYRLCLEQAMKDDIYFGRCTRKLKRFDLLEKTSSSEVSILSPVSSATSVSGGDPEMPSLPKPVDVSNETSEAPVTDTTASETIPYSPSSVDERSDKEKLSKESSKIESKKDGDAE